MEAIHAGKEVDRILIQKGLQSELFHEFRMLLAKSEIPYQFVPIEKLNRITRKNHQGVIGFVCNVTYQDIENVIPMLFEQGKTPLIMVLDHIIEEIGGDPVAGVVFEGDVAAGAQPSHIRSVALRLVFEPADVIGGAFHQPAGIMHAVAAELLDDMLERPATPCLRSTSKDPP